MLPGLGAALRIAVGVRLRRVGERTMLRVPDIGLSTVATISRCFTWASSKTLSTLRMGPQGTPASLKASTQ